MTARDKILNQIIASKPSLVELPEIDSSVLIQYDDLFMQFKKMLETIGGSAIEVKKLSTLIEKIQEKTANGLMVMNTVPELGEVQSHLQFLSADILAGVDTAYIRGTIAAFHLSASCCNNCKEKYCSYYAIGLSIN